MKEELNILKQLKHKNIIAFIHAWINKKNNELIFITECVVGGDLKQ